MMNNHFHFLAETPLGNLGEFMRHFNITYTSYFNRQHRRVGHLYQGRYKSFLVEKEAYLSACSSYIHLNPVKVGALQKKPVKEQADYLLKYKWSSLPGYLAPQKRIGIVNCKVVLEEFGGDIASGRKAYKAQLLRDLTEGMALHENIVGQSLLGSDTFVDWARENFLDKKRDRERPSVGEINRHVAKDEILRIIAESLGTPASAILKSKGQKRQIAMEILYRFGGFSNKAIGEMMDLDYSSISQGRKRLLEKRRGDSRLDKVLRCIELQLSRIKI